MSEEILWKKDSFGMPCHSYTVPAADDMFEAAEFDFEFSVAVEMMCSHVDYQTASETIRKQMEEDREFEKSIRDAREHL